MDLLYFCLIFSKFNLLYGEISIISIIFLLFINNT